MSALIGAIIGGVLAIVGGGLAVAFERDSNRKAALTALAVEWGHLAGLDRDDLKRKIGKDWHDVAFTPIPKDAYTLALQYIGDLDKDARGQLVELAFLVSAYNASATFFNEHPDRDDVIIRIFTIGEEAIKKAGPAMQAFRRAVPSLNLWVPE